MQKNMQAASPVRGAVHTLAQNGTGNVENSAVIIQGKGSELNNAKALQGRAKRKMITQATVLSLIDASAKKGTDERAAAYWNTYHCQSRVYTVNGRLHGNYCKNRFCTLCCAIRKAELINKYLPVLQTWPQPYFVTLTVKAYNYKSLRMMAGKVLQGFTIIKDRYRKKSQRGNGKKLVGIKALECNFNPLKGTYNPHLHLIVQDKETADILVKEWLEIWGRKFASAAGQHVTAVRNQQAALIEVIKYGSKIFTEPDVNKKAAKCTGESKENRSIHAAALDNIFAAMQGKRIFERFGFNLPQGTPIHQQPARLAADYQEWVYQVQQYDWINTATQKRLSDYMPDLQLRDLLENRVNTAIE